MKQHSRNSKIIWFDSSKFSHSFYVLDDFLHVLFSYVLLIVDCYTLHRLRFYTKRSYYVAPALTLRLPTGLVWLAHTPPGQFCEYRLGCCGVKQKHMKRGNGNSRESEIVMKQFKQSIQQVGHKIISESPNVLN